MMRCTDCGVPAERLYAGRCLVCADAKYEAVPEPVVLGSEDDSFDDHSDVLLDPLDVNGRWAQGRFVNTLEV